MSVNVRDILSDSLEKILACASSRRHGELITHTKALVAALHGGDFAPSANNNDDAGSRESEPTDVKDAAPTTAAAAADGPGTPSRPPRLSANGGGATGFGQGGLRGDQVEALLVPLRLAFDSKSPKIIEAALTALQKLIAHGQLRGDADILPSGAVAEAATPTHAGGESSTADGVSDASNLALTPTLNAQAINADAEDSPTVSSAETNAPGPHGVAPAGASAPVHPRAVAEHHAGEVIELACRASEILEETVELQVLKCLLTAVSSKTFRVHGKALLRVVRTCYNIFLGSKSEVNQSTAKASLTQMLTIVFHRLEADSSEAPAPTIVVADLLRPGTHTKDDDTVGQMVLFVQQFVNKVISDINTVSVLGTNIAAGAMGGADDDGIVEVVPGSAKQEVTETEFDNDESVPHAPRSLVGGGVAGAARAYEEEGTAGTARSKESTVLETDALAVFRALCKQAKKPGDLNNVSFVRGKTLSLELLKILLENAGPMFCTSPRLVEATKEYLCDAVVTNAEMPSIPGAAYQLACSIFLTLLTRFRKSLKAQVGFFFPKLILKHLEVVHGSPLAPYNQRAILLKCLDKLCGDAQLLVDMFVNFDCDLDSSNLFERLVNSLVRVAQGLPGVADLTGAEAAREQFLKGEALECLSGMLEALGSWVDEQLGTVEAKKAAAAAAAVAAAKQAVGNGGSVLLDNASDSAETASEVSGIEQKKASKLEYQEAITMFNKKAKKGIAMMQKMGRLGTSPAEIAEFLRCTPDLDKAVIGDYLGEREEPMFTVMHAYVDAMDFSEQTLDEAIRKFLEGFRLPGEAQKIDRLMEKFAERYCKQNPGAYKSADTAYVLSYSVIMLNTDAHNPQVKNKMTKEGFLRNNKGIDDGQDLDPNHLSDLYDRIVNNEIRMKDEDPELIAQKAEANNAGSGSMVNRAMKDMSNRLGMDVLLSLVAGRKIVAPVDTSAWMDEVRARAKRDASGFHTASDPACVRPMLEVAWPAMLAVFSMSFEATEAAAVVQTSLMGFRRAIHLTAAMGMESVRDAFITPLAKLTSLHSPSNMRSKNISAMRALMAVGVSDGNALGGAWVHILKAVSRYDHLYSLAAGYNDASLFEGSAGGDKGDKGGSSGGRLFKRVGGGLAKSADAAASAMKSLKSPSTSSKGIGGMTMPTMPTMSGMFSGSSMSSMFGGTAATDESPFAHLKKSAAASAPATPGPAAAPKTSFASTPGTTRGEATDAEPPSTPMTGSGGGDPKAEVDKIFLHELDIVPPPVGVLEQLSPDELARIFHISDQLDGEAVVAFVRSLCTVSLEETAARSPRVYSLTKLVEIAHLNMSRIRFVWSRIWSVLADFFVTSGCHPNLQVAMYVVDSLRQLAMKFLERGELANYSFQNDFLRPFVVVMRQSPSTEIRELIIRCMSQMVLARVCNIKSGWKSMFMVFTTAAADEQRGIVVLAFETIERIIREHFVHITDTDATAFTDCVNCLIAFTNSDCSPDVSLNAIAFLRYCALKLADGSLGNLDEPRKDMGPDMTWEGDGEGAEAGISSSRPKTPPPREREKGTTCFTDADVHVYFWFPLLAGLSELTFDPRPEIRRSALEVLFDILKFHGDNFSPGFWARVYDSILLPIFDHVRAEVGGQGEEEGGGGTARRDNGTDKSADSADHYAVDAAGIRFKPPRRDHRSDIDAWLHQTCQHCLELVVDLTVQFYASVTQAPTVLPRFLTLLTSLAARPHEALAACGIGALSRLLLSAGHLFDADAWDLAVGALARVTRETLPDVRALVAGANDSYVDNATAGNGIGHDGGITAETAAALLLGCHPSTWLRATREATALAVTQRLLVQATAELYFRHGDRLSGDSLDTLVGTLEVAASHAADVDADADLCRRLCRATAAAAAAVAEQPSLVDGSNPGGGGGRARFLPDPPLITMEVEASQASLAVLLHLHTGGDGGTAGTRSKAAEAAAAERRLVALTLRVLTGFAALAAGRDEGDSTGVGGDVEVGGLTRGGGVSNERRSGGHASVSTQARDELAARAPLTVDALKALARFSPAAFEGNLGAFFPVLTQLIKCEHVPAEVSRTLSDVFGERVGPLILASLPPG